MHRVSGGNKDDLLKRRYGLLGGKDRKKKN